ncbi:hypothetical protein [Sphingomonas alba]|uniref:Uncharacterized protein n=1 Tax=Sphingomonas alba TaxID=2908208 RepID=A0ABT0RM84_9SPHN|nr:hypothetical protein [Sphingomonas alba]MCL6683757.1 hypothetical protein [Sphingomonas alba]
MTNTVCGAVIDWAATGSMLQGLGTIAGVSAVVWGTLKATGTWKAQKLAERRSDNAERILTAVYKGRRAIKYIRGVMVWAHELSAAEAKLKENPDWERATEARQKRLVTAQAYYDRLNRTKDERLALDECLPMARALFGEELEAAIEKLNHQFWIVQTYVDAYIDDENGNDAEFTKKIRRAMSEVEPRAGETSEVSEAVKETVTIVERICVPALQLEGAEMAASA